MRLTLIAARGSLRRFSTVQDEAYLRQRKTEWKRRQKGHHFVDFLIVNVRGGKGGNGCVAFNREKYKPFGPPSGGNGGRGGDVFFLPTPEISSLSSVPRSIRGEPGGHGQGTWQHGKNGSPLIVKVPLGTVVRQLSRNDPRREKDEWEDEQEALARLTADEAKAKMRERRWLHYPRHSEDNEKRDVFREAEYALLKQERERRMAWRKREAYNPLQLDLDNEMSDTESADAPLGLRRRDFIGHLIAAGGAGGLGNPYFHSLDNRSPKYATCGHEGERITLALELKLLADIALVGLPNAGKSTLLRALTGGRARTEVAGYAFTTLNPVVGVVRVAQNGTFEGGLSPGMVHDETLTETQREQYKMQRGDYAFSPTRNQRHDSELASGHSFDIAETFRFTIADNPGLISGSSKNIGLGHSFLRAMERSLALVYVVDLSGTEPWEDLRILREELEQYQPGFSAKAQMVIANKADLLAEDGHPAEVLQAKDKLKKLEQHVLEMYGGRKLDVIPVSAKFSQNLSRVVVEMQRHVANARTIAQGLQNTPAATTQVNRHEGLLDLSAQ